MNLVRLICPLVVIPHTKSKNQPRGKTSFNILQVRVVTLKRVLRELADVLTRPSVTSEGLGTSGDVLGGCIFRKARWMHQGGYGLVVASPGPLGES